MTERPTRAAHLRTPTRGGPMRGEWILVVGLAVGLVLRIVVAHTSLGTTNSDEAAGMLMADRAAHGHFYAFFWGENYGGTLMTWLEAPFVALFGLHVTFFRAANDLVTLVDAVLVRLIAGRLMSKAAAQVAAVLFFAFPPLWVAWSMAEYVWWGPGIGLALAAVLCCARWNDDRRPGRLLPIGLLMGMSFWMYPLLGTIVVAPFLAVTWALRRTPRDLPFLVGLIPVGALPWIYNNATHHWTSLHTQVNPISPGPVRLEQSVTQVLPSSLLSDLPWVATPHATKVLGLGVLVVAAVFVVVMIVLRRMPLVLVGLPVIIWPPFVAFSGVMTIPSAFRYAFVLLPSLVVIGTFLADRVASTLPAVGRPALFGAVAIGVLLLTTAGADRVTNGFQTTTYWPPSTSAVARYLEANGRTHVYAGYWVGYRLSVASGARVSACPTITVREPEVCDQAAAAPGTTYVFLAGNLNDRQMSTWLSSHPVGQRVQVQDVAVYVFTTKVPRSTLPLMGSF